VTRRDREGATAGSRLAAVWQRPCSWFSDRSEGEDMSDLSGKVALVSGAARGFGGLEALTDD
jgi:hypothetical protein